MTITTFLLDLDNTLLGNPMARFLPAYFAALERYLRPLVGDQDIRRLMSASVQALQRNQDPTITNMAAFMEEFSQRTRVDAEALQASFETFYREDFPLLQRHTDYRPAARQIVQHLLENGFTVVIATNPLFPETAIMQRLAWAGVAGLPYARVTTMENSAYSKPNPRYYLEILEQIDSGPAETWMVGDDVEQDIEPAQQLGMKTWWITDAADDAALAHPPPCDRQGTLIEFWAWIRTLAGAEKNK